MTVSTSIPVAVMTVAAFRALGRPASILEANLAQTIGSASTALATGGVFTLPALFLWGLAPPYFQVVVVALLGGVLGISAMIPLRDLLIVRSSAELPYPEGTACAEVLRATTAGTPGGGWILGGFALGSCTKLALALFALLPDQVSAPIGLLPNAEVALEIAPALVAVGYLLGYRQSAVVVSGSVLSSLVLIPLITEVGARLGVPLAPETTRLVAAMGPGEVWSHYVRYVGAGAVAMAGIVTVLATLPSMLRALAAVWRGLRRGEEGARRETDRDLPAWVVLVGVAVVVLAVALVPGVLGARLSFVQRFVCAAIVGSLGVAFVTVASRIVGIVGVSSQPTSGITLVTLLAICGVFAACGWTGPVARVAVLLVGAIVAIAASKAGDISQDLKTGQLVGATPATQQLGQYLGAATACWTVAATLLFLGKAYTFGSAELPAPQATLMKTIIEGVLAGTLPWHFVLAGAGVAATAMLAGVNGLAFAIGVYLPLGSMAAIFVGGCVRGGVELRRRRAARRRGHSEAGAEVGADAGTLAASGLVAGEGLAGVVVAVLIGGFHVAHPAAPRIAGAAGSLGALAVVALVGLFLARAGGARREGGASEGPSGDSG
jgi:putative OPT family oligopeptide transporter